MALAELCFDTLMEEGVKAKIALEAGVKRSLRQILCFPELDLKVPDLQEHMQSTMGLLCWRNAIICTMEKRFHLER